MLLLIPVLPFFGFLVNAGLGRRVSKAAAGAVACAVMLASFGMSLVAVWRLVALPPESRALVQQVFSWITSGDFNVGLTLRLDPLSAVMILVVTGIGSLIHLYSTAYMHDETDGEYARYLAWISPRQVSITQVKLVFSELRQVVELECKLFGSRKVSWSGRCDLNARPSEPHKAARLGSQRKTFRLPKRAAWLHRR